MSARIALTLASAVGSMLVQARASAAPTARGADYGWDKVREMLRNAPAPQAHQKVEAEPESKRKKTRASRRQTRKNRALLILIALGLVIAGAFFFAFDKLRPLVGTMASEKATGAKDTQAAKPAVEPVPAVEVKTMTIRKGLKAVNVRSGPSVSATPVGKLTGGASVEKLSESGPWTKIRFTVDRKQSEGWIRADLLEN